MQRDASGLGEDLDYAYKIADAEALADRLATQLRVANGALRDSQLALSDMHDQLFAARRSVRQQDVRMVGLLASLEAARREPANAALPKVERLEQEIATVAAQLQQSQTAILRLERERDAARIALNVQLAGGQATQLELRELLARTERAEGQAESLAAQLAEAEQRLIHSDQEIRELQTAYREESERLAADRERLLTARSRSESDGAAYLAASETEIASKAARIAGLESQIGNLQDRLAGAEDSTVEDSLRQAVAALRARYDKDVAALQRDRERLTESLAASREQLAARYAESKKGLAAKDTELNSRRREIDTLAAESARLRARVDALEAQQLREANQSGLNAAQLQARLAMSRQKVITLRNSLDELQTEKSSLEAQLLKDRMALQDQMVSEKAASAQEVNLLRAEIAAAESTIDVQTLRIAALEKQKEDVGAELAGLKSDLGEPESVAADMQAASIVLDMARSTEEPNLGRFHALLIANEKYINMEPLSTPIRDAIEIEKLLINRYGFSVKILQNATENRIMEELDEYSITLTEEDNLLIYYAGRGSTPDGPPDRAYWLGVDADPELRNTWLLAEHVSEKIKQIQAQRILLVTDSCFSKRRLQSVSMSVGRGLDPEKFKLLAQFRSRYVLTSGANVPVYDESGDRTHSLFAKFFIEILRQNKNVLSGEMLSYEMAYRVRESIENPERATPTYNILQDVGHKAGDFFFVPMPQPLLVASVSMI